MSINASSSSCTYHDVVEPPPECAQPATTQRKESGASVLTVETNAHWGREPHDDWYGTWENGTTDLTGHCSITFSAASASIPYKPRNTFRHLSDFR